jgi:ankyrin repeat protein
MRKLLERIVDTCRYNLGQVPEKAYYIDDHVERGNCAVVEKLFRENSGLSQHRDMFGNPLLIRAVWERQIEMCSLLLRLGCKPDDVDAKGATALHHAVDLWDPQLIELLIAGGALTEVADENGDLPVDWAEPSQKSDFQRIAGKAPPATGRP